MKRTYEIDIDNLTEEDKKTFEILVEKARSMNLDPIYPAKGSDAYELYSDSYIEKVKYIDTPFDRSRYLNKSLFKTKTEAEFERERRKVIFELEEYKRQYDKVELDWEDATQKKYQIKYDFSNNKFIYEFAFEIKCAGIYFSSSEIAKNAIAAIGEDRIKKYYFGVTDFKKGNEIPTHENIRMSKMSE